MGDYGPYKADIMRIIGSLGIDNISIDYWRREGYGNLTYYLPNDPAGCSLIWIFI
jgi:hypothetical protein